MLVTHPQLVLKMSICLDIQETDSRINSERFYHPQIYEWRQIFIMVMVQGHGYGPLQHMAKGKVR